MKKKIKRNRHDKLRNLWSNEPRHEKTGCFAYAKTKTQISFAVTAKLISAFVFATRIVQSLYFLNPKFQTSSHLVWLYSPVCVGPGRKPRRPVFSERGSNNPKEHCKLINSGDKNDGIHALLQDLFNHFKDTNETHSHEYESEILPDNAFCRDESQDLANEETNQPITYDELLKAVKLLKYTYSSAAKGVSVNWINDP